MQPGGVSANDTHSVTQGAEVFCVAAHAMQPGGVSANDTRSEACYGAGRGPGGLIAAGGAAVS
jgi:hypothetical protein